MKHYIAVSLDISYKNIVIIGFDTERKADNSIEKLNVYNAQHGYTVFSVDYFGYCDEQEVVSYYSKNIVLQFIDRKNPLNNRAITTIGKSLLEAYNE